MAFIEMQAVTKQYRLGEATIHALRGVDLQIEPGEFIAVWGPSGSGKTSLLNLIGLIDRPTSGRITFDGRDVLRLSDNESAELRNRKVGFIFQTFNLIPVLNALENVMLPLQLQGLDARQAGEKAMERLEEVGLGQQAAARPDQMSGGQRQRVAIARALIASPAVIIADEPTANLDSDTSSRIISLMRELNDKEGITFIFSTHDPRLLSHVKRSIKLEDGRMKRGGSHELSEARVSQHP
jgi:putative ABC transport system ATP-binding protein